MRARRWLLVGVVVALGALWWIADQARQSTEVSSAHAEKEHAATTSRVDGATSIASERKEVTTPVAADADAVDADASIRGVVTLPDGTAPPMPVTVIAWPRESGRYMSESDVRDVAVRVLEGDRAVPQAHTVADGSFAIEHVRNGATYSLAAGALGYMTKDYPGRAIAGGASVTLVVQPMYVALVHLIDSKTRGPVRVSQRLNPAQHVRVKMTVIDRGLESGYREGADSVLAGLPVDLASSMRQLRSVAHVYASASGPAHIGPIQLQVDVPGYEAATLEYFAEPLAKGLHEIELALVPVAAERGELVVRWKGIPTELQKSAPTDVPWGSVKLTPASGRVLEFLVSELSQRELLLDEIPFGDYVASVTVRSAGGNKAVVEDRALEINSSRAELEVDLGRLGALAFDVRHADGGAYDRELSATLEFAARESNFGVNFRTTPYVVLAIDPDDWKVNLMTPKLPAPDQLFEIHAGELTTLKFVLP